MTNDKLAPGLPILFEWMSVKVRREQERMKEICRGDVDLDEAVFGFGDSIVSSFRDGIYYQRWGTFLDVSHRFDWDHQFLTTMVLANGYVVNCVTLSEVDANDTVQCFVDGVQIASLHKYRRSNRRFASKWKSYRRIVNTFCISRWLVTWKGQQVGMLRCCRILDDSKSCGLLKLRGRQYEIPLSRGANIKLQRRLQDSDPETFLRKDCADYLLPYPQSIGDDAILCGIVHLLCRRSRWGATLAPSAE